MKNEHKVATLDGLKISYFERYGNGSATILLCHATGFHARCWDAVVRYLPENVRIVAIEHRGHGRSQKTGPYTWTNFGQDLIHFIRELDLVNIIGVGHSMGGYTLVYAAAAELSRFRELLLVDPVIMSPEQYQGRTQSAQLADHPIARRVNHWESPQAMFQSFESRHPFSLWKKEVLWDYCSFGLELDPDPPEPKKPYRLCCPPKVEAAIYAGNTDGNIHSLFDQVQLPTTIFRAQERELSQTRLDFSKSPTWPKLASHLPNAQEHYLPFLSHFIPMQDPFLLATQISRTIAQES